MSFHHRLPAIGTALLSSMAVLLAAFAGSSCDFLTITATFSSGIVSPNDSSVGSGGDGVDGGTVASGILQDSLGVLCEHDLYDREGDKMWELSRIFLIVALTLGSATAALAWAVSTYLAPSEWNWKTISFLAATTAVMQIPIFVLFEAEPCSGFRAQQTCSMGSGSYFLIASAVLFVAVTLCTQCLDPPEWALELALWRAPKKQGASRRRRPRGVPRHPRDDGYNYNDDDDEESLQREHHQRRQGERDLEDFAGDIDYRISHVLPSGKSHTIKEEKLKTPSRQGFWTGWFRPVPNDIDVKAVETKSINEDDYAYEDQLDRDRVILRVLPDAKASTGREHHLTTMSLEDEEADSMANVADNAALNDSHQSCNKPLPGAVAQVYTFSQEVERHHDDLCSTEQSLAKDGNLISSEDILADLQTETTKAPPELQAKKEKGDTVKAETSTSKIVFGVRTLTKKLKRDSKRRRQSSRLTRRRGYSQMLNDDEDDYLSDHHSDDGDKKQLKSPPFEVQFPTGTNNWAEPALGDTAMPDVSDDEDGMMENDNWHTLGIRKATDDFTAIGEGPFDTTPVDSYDSDPETGSFDDVLPPPSFGEIAGDSSTVSSGDKSNAESQNSSDSRGRDPFRPENNNYGHRRKRPISPVGSIRSQGSLLRTTINEETAEDIEKELDAAYAMSRTVSAPMLKTVVASRRPTAKSPPMEDMEIARTMDRGTSQPSDEMPKSFVDNELKPKHTVSGAQTFAPSNSATDTELGKPEHPMKDAQLPAPKSSWNEPNLSSTLWRKERSALPPLPTRRETYQSVNISGETSRTEKTDDTDDSTLSDDEEVETSRLAVRRSRSLGPSSRRIGRLVQTKSLSPSRRTRKETQEANKSNVARTLRLRRLQKKAGYVALDDKGRAESPTRKTGDDRTHSNASTPKRKTIHMIDEKKEDDPVLEGAAIRKAEERSQVSFPTPYFDSTMTSDLSLPALSDKNSIASFMADDPLDLNVDSLLEQLDLQLIEVRRPIGREYGDDELSL